jgi:hypothetical protein
MESSKVASNLKSDVSFIRDPGPELAFAVAGQDMLEFKFDKLSFGKYMKNIGRDYRYSTAMRLIREININHRNKENDLPCSRSIVAEAAVMRVILIGI